MAVGLSGGVDSSVAAWLLKQRGYDVVGVFMKNWPPPGEAHLQGNCPFEEDSMFAEMVARRLDIPFEIADLSEYYNSHVVSYLFREYAAGRTPNPDVLCNREIKFEVFWDVARKFGASFVATGHYCRRVDHYTPANGRLSHLYEGADRNKDQSYFLCQVTQEQLQRALFPVGSLLKPQVRKIARELHLPTAARKDSYGICFVGEVDLPSFLNQRIAPKDGNVVEIAHGDELNDWLQAQPADDSQGYTLASAPGRVIGRHKGAWAFTVGQRKGLDIGGKAEPLYVLGTDTSSNTIYVGQGKDHPLLYRHSMLLGPDAVHWIVPNRALHPGETLQVQARLRYRQPLQVAELSVEANGVYRLRFREAQRGVTPGQYAAWYENGCLLGSAPVRA